MLASEKNVIIPKEIKEKSRRYYTVFSVGRENERATIIITNISEQNL